MTVPDELFAADPTHVVLSTPSTGAGTDPVAVTVSAEELSVGTEWVVSGRVRLRRTVVSETRMVEVTVRREELTVEAVDGAVFSNPAGGVVGWRGTALDGPPVAEPPSVPRPTVIVLQEEVPQIALWVQAYERVTARVALVSAAVDVRDQVRREQLDLDVTQIGDPARSEQDAAAAR